MLRPHEIDLRAPVEPGHPLNRGRVAWLSGHPYVSGGAAWRDLCQRYAGTLAGGAAWVAGRVDLTADAHRVEFAPSSGGGTAWSWAVDAAVMTGTADNGAVFGRAYNTGQGQFYYRTATSRLDYWEGGSLRIAGATAGSVPINTRVRLLFVRDGTAAMLYANGVLVGSGTAGSAAALAADTLAVGRETIGSAAARMRVFEVAVWGRALAANEAWLDYDLSRRGYPGLGGPLRRVTNRRWLLLRDSDAGGGGTTYPESYAGSLSAAGALTGLVSKAVAGSSTGAGALAKLTAKPLAGSATAAAALAKLAAKPLAGSQTATGAATKAVAKATAGSSTPAGALSAIKVALLALAGSCTSAGAMARAAAKAVVGSVTGAGAVAKAAGKAAAGSAAPAGAVTKQASKATAGSAQSAGALSTTRATLLAVAGAVTAAGSLVRAAWKALAGLVTGAGVLTTSGGTAPTQTPTHPPLAWSRPARALAWSRPSRALAWRSPGGP